MGNTFMNSMILGGGKSGSEMATERVGLENKIKNLEEQARVMEQICETQEGKYREAYGRKEWYKARTQELEEKMKEIKDEVDTEKAKYTLEKEKETASRLTQTVKNYGLLDEIELARERKEMLEEEIVKLKKDHKEEKEKMVETYEAQSCIENGKVAKANIKIMNLETESKKARNHYN